MKTKVKAAGWCRSSAWSRRVFRAGPARPRYNDWTLPKGKAEGDEDREDTAQLGGAGGDGVPMRLGPAIATVRYTDHLGHPKVVHYWLMYPAEGVFTAGEGGWTSSVGGGAWTFLDVWP